MNDFFLKKIYIIMFLKYYTLKSTIKGCVNVQHTHWKFVDKWSHAVDMRNVLLQFIPTHDLYMFPCGTCICPKCDQIISFNEKTLVYKQEENAVCEKCRSPTDEVLRKVEFTMNMEVSDKIFDTLFPTDKIYLTTCPLPPIDHEKGKAICKVHTSYHYIQNKNAKDLYHDVLARRVIQRLRTNVLQRRVAWVLYECANIGLDASIFLSKKIT
jgi:hypothetical protein